MLKYQDQLLSHIDSMTPATFPRSVMFIGENGCGKHTLCTYLSNKFNIQLFDITDKISLELITEIALQGTEGFYLINLTDITIKEQNVILKFLEEPPASAYIIVLAEYANQVIPTVMNRCEVYEFGKYTPEQLQTFLDDNSKVDIIRYCTTPGDVLKFEHTDIDLVQKTCDTFLAFLPEAPTAAALYSYTNKLAFDDELNKIDVLLFLRCFLITLHSKILSGAPLYAEYKLTSELLKSYNIPNIKKLPLWENYVIELQRTLRSNNET